MTIWSKIIYIHIKITIIIIDVKIVSPDIDTGVGSANAAWFVDVVWPGEIQ